MPRNKAKGKVLGLLAIGLLSGPISANAVSMTYNWTVNASGFAPILGNPPPQDPVTAVLSFVPPPVGSDSGTVSSFNLVIGSTTYTSAKFLAGPGSVVFSNNCNGACFVDINLPGFGFVLKNWETAPSLSSFSYSLGDGTGIYTTLTGSVTNTAVPEPGTLALLSFGLLGLGMSRRKVPIRT